MAFGGSVAIGPHAVVRGDVNVAGGQVMVDPATKLMGQKINIRNGEKEEEQSPKPLLMDTNKFLTAAFWVSQVLLLIGMFLVVGVVHLIVPNFTKKVVLESSPQNFWKSFLTGLVLLIVMPFAALLSFITVIGGFVGGLILIAYVGFIVISILYGGVVFGGLLYELIKKPKKYNMGWAWLLLGVVGLHVVSWIPAIGWLIGFVFILTAWGAIASLKWKQVKAM
jgi:hypothetical protein